ncbi:RHS repeat-associated core domain-containing protein [Xanthomonas sp. D-109]|uniref:RHS repeat domain-containing protein n=1 Tax=Xanthomonas sp. D-109 TaxID=2821274 RepID=UPI001ADD5BFD|nr:RHS repeat-associated core domain-containing protein [Xanthomonas sp. D-109]MBO9881032.1 RHS repeat-associated core domain-containing protein [Xanthomonas sp. D-109]
MSNFQGIRAVRRLMAVAALPLLVAFGASAQTVRYIHTDGLGSVVLVTDGDRNVVSRNEYTPYGSLLNRPIMDVPGYAGHIMDAATELTYMQQRYYDSLIGRFLSVDTVTPYDKPVTNFNRYGYALNNPYKFTDPDGRDILVISGGLREGGFNWAGHVASAVQGDGMSSYGNDTPRHSSVADYIGSQSKLRPQQVTVIPRTPQQDAAARDKAATLPTEVTKLDNCAVRTNQILEASGISTSVVPLPKVTEAVAAEQPGAVTYQIPKGGEIPKALQDQLPKFEAPKNIEKTK